MSTMQAIIGPISGLIALNRSNAQSKEALRLVELQRKIQRGLLSSYSLSEARGRVLDDLDALYDETYDQGWDGYGAIAMNPDAYEFAKIFIEALPSTAPLPELSADPDGEVSLGWNFGSRRALSVSIGPTGRCTFAWILGQRSSRGTDWIEDDIPASVAFALCQLAPA